MATDVYLQLDGIKGESSDDKHKGWIECQDCDFGVANPRDSDASTERAAFDAISIFKVTDLATPLLLQHCASSKSFSKARLSFMRADGQGERVKYFEMELDNVRIALCRPNVQPGGMIEQVQLKFRKVTWKYTQQKIAGGIAGNTTGNWDLVTNKVIA